jgi:hypothetical protein
MIASGLRATLTCVDPKQLDPAFVGRSFDVVVREPVERAGYWFADLVERRGQPTTR